MLYLCDNKALMKAVKRWIDKGRKATISRSTRNRYLLEIVEELRKKTTAEAATFLVKVKAHRGKPAHDKAIPGKNSATEWHDRINRAVFTWQEPQQKED